jgi:hypothetical protein
VFDNSYFRNSNNKRKKLYKSLLRLLYSINQLVDFAIVVNGNDADANGKREDVNMSRRCTTVTPFTIICRYSIMCRLAIDVA